MIDGRACPICRCTPTGSRRSRRWGLARGRRCRERPISTSSAHARGDGCGGYPFPMMIGRELAPRMDGAMVRRCARFLPGVFTGRRCTHVSASTSRPTGSIVPGVAIDPLVPSEPGLEWFSERASSPKAVLLSNRHHYRDSDRFVEAFGCSVHCNRAGLHEFSHGEAVEGFEPGTRCPVVCWRGEVGGICPDEPALYLPNSVPSPSPTASSAVEGKPHPASGPDSLMDDPSGTQRRPARCLRAAPRPARLRARPPCAWRSSHRRWSRGAAGPRRDRRANRIRTRQLKIAELAR